MLLGSIVLKAKTDISKLVQYCQLIATPGILSNRVTIDIDFGKEKSFGGITGLKG